MRRFLGAVAMMGMVGAAAIGLWAGVGRAAGPAPVSPLADRVVVLSATDVAPTSAPARVVAREAAVVPAAEPVVAEPATATEPVVSVEPVAAPAASVVVSCGTGPEGAFVEVAGVADCPGSAAVRIEATTNA